MRRVDTDRALSSVFLVLTLLIFMLNLPYGAEATSHSAQIAQHSSTVGSPSVILQNGANNVSYIYADNTSAKIQIMATNISSSKNYSLNIFNNNSSSWEVRLEYYSCSNPNCTSATIILHNDSFSLWQIKIEEGNISQNSTYYNLAGNTTIYIGVQNLVGNVNGTTILHAYLIIKTPDKTTYALYEITFEFDYSA